MPERMFRDRPPSREAVRISRTWPEFTEVKPLTSSGIRAPAIVPQVMIIDSFHHSVESPWRLGTRRYESTKVIPMEISEVSHTRGVRGGSKLNFFASSHLALAIIP